MTKLINGFLLVVFFNLTAAANPVDSIYTAQIDTLVVESRSFDHATIEEFKADSDFQYSRPKEGISWLQRIFIWALTQIAQLLYLGTHTTPGKIIFYGLCAALIVYIILRFLNIDIKDLFFKSGNKRINFKIAEENIHELDFDKLIEEAMKRKEYRDAVRLVFLFSLKKLSDAQLIQWMPGKTNDEYLSELAQHPARQRLQELRYYFDYAWYGHFEITDKTFASVHKTFHDFKATLP